MLESEDYRLNYTGMLFKSHPRDRNCDQHGPQCNNQLPVFPPDCAIAGILRCIQRWPQKNGEKANLALYFYKALCRLNRGIVF